MSPSPRPQALVTGASVGIGRQLAIDLARRGWNLLLTARDRESLEAVARVARDRHASTVTVSAHDLATPAGVDGVLEDVGALASPLGLLVNNAGLGIHGPYLESDPHREIELLRVNIEALVRLTRGVLPEMVARGSGRILNVGSTAGFAPGPLMTTYYASKAFVLSYSEALDEELRGSGVSVTCLCPGPTRTRFLGRAGAESAPAGGAGMDAGAVARAGIDGVLAGRRRVVPGVWNALSTVAVRGLPRDVVTRIVGHIQRTRR